MKKITVIFLSLFISLSSVAYADGPFQKLGRGFTNILTSPLEYVAQTVDLAEDNHYMVAVFGGIFKGTVFMVARILTGAYDIVTFPVPLPKHYEPLMRPETVFDKLNTVD